METPPNQNQNQAAAFEFNPNQHLSRLLDRQIIAINICFTFTIWKSSDKVNLWSMHLELEGNIVCIAKRFIFMLMLNHNH